MRIATVKRNERLHITVLKNTKLKECGRCLTTHTQGLGASLRQTLVSVIAMPILCLIWKLLHIGL